MNVGSGKEGRQIHYDRNYVKYYFERNPGLIILARSTKDPWTPVQKKQRGKGFQSCAHQDQ